VPDRPTNRSVSPETYAAFNRAVREAVRRPQPLRRRHRVRLFDVLADDAGVAERHALVAIDGNAAHGTELGEVVIGKEGDDRIDLDLDALERAHREHFARIGRDGRADDRCLMGAHFGITSSAPCSVLTL
jgi:hypothetical protein